MDNNTYELFENKPNIEYDDLIFKDLLNEIDSKHFELFQLSPNVQDLNDLNKSIVRTILRKEIVTKKITMKN